MFVNYRFFLKTARLLFFLLETSTLTAVELNLVDDEYIEIAGFNGRMNAILAVAFSPDGKTIALGLSNGKVEIWNIEEKKIKNSFMCGFATKSIIFSPDGNLILLRSLDGDIKLYNRSGVFIETCLSNGSTGKATSAVFISNGSVILVTYLNGKIRFYDVLENKITREIGPAGSIAMGLASSRDGKSVAIDCFNGEIILWDSEKNIESQIASNSWCASEIIFSPDGRFIGAAVGTAHFDGKIKLWQIETKEIVRKFCYRGPCFTKYGNKAVNIAFSPDGRLIAAGDSHGIVRLWDIVENKCIHEFSDHRDAILSIAFSPDGTKIAATDGFLIVWTDNFYVSAKKERQRVDKNSIITLASAMHPRLGADSSAQTLSSDVLHWISEFFLVTPWDEVFEKQRISKLTSGQ